jgi:hypothetical protein
MTVRHASRPPRIYYVKATCEGEFVQVCMHRDIVLTLCSVLLLQRLLECVNYRHQWEDVRSEILKKCVGG